MSNSTIDQQGQLEVVEHIAEIAILSRTLDQMARTPVRDGHILSVLPINATPDGISNGIGTWLILAFLWNILMIVVGVILAVGAIPFVIPLLIAHGTDAFIPTAVVCGLLYLYLVAWQVLRGAVRFWCKL